MFDDIFNSDDSGGLPSWLEQAAGIYDRVTGGSDQGTYGPPSPPVQGPPAPGALTASLSGAMPIILLMVIAALAFGVRRSR
jgi:hypothetical protein